MILTGLSERAEVSDIWVGGRTWYGWRSERSWSSVAIVAGMDVGVNPGDAFDALYRDVEPRLRRALVAAYGLERGREATAEALAWAWAHQDRLSELASPVAYLFRVGQSRSRRRLHRHLIHRPTWDEPWVEPALGAALAELSERQRVTVMLVHGYDWTLAEVADLLGVKATTVQNHLERGMAKLRSHLEVDPDA